MPLACAARIRRDAPRVGAGGAGVHRQVRGECLEHSGLIAYSVAAGSGCWMPWACIPCAIRA